MSFDPSPVVCSIKPASTGSAKIPNICTMQTWGFYSGSIESNKILNNLAIASTIVTGTGTLVGVVGAAYGISRDRSDREVAGGWTAFGGVIALIGYGISTGSAGVTMDVTIKIANEYKNCKYAFHERSAGLYGCKYQLGTNTKANMCYLGWSDYVLQKKPMLGRIHLSSTDIGGEASMEGIVAWGAVEIIKSADITHAGFVRIATKLRTALLSIVGAQLSTVSAAICGDSPSTQCTSSVSSIQILNNKPALELSRSNTKFLDVLTASDAVLGYIKVNLGNALTSCRITVEKSSTLPSEEIRSKMVKYNEWKNGDPFYYPSTIDDSQCEVGCYKGTMSAITDGWTGDWWKAGSEFSNFDTNNLCNRPEPRNTYVLNVEGLGCADRPLDTENGLIMKIITALNSKHHDGGPLHTYVVDGLYGTIDDICGTT